MLKLMRWLIKCKISFRSVCSFSLIYSSPSDFTCNFTWLLMTFVVNKPRIFGHLFSSTHRTCTSYESLFQFAFTYIFPFRTAMYKRYINSIIIIIWKSNSSRFKMSKQKIRIEWLWRPRVILGSRGFSWAVFGFGRVLKWPAQKASGPERHPFDSAEPIITLLTSRIWMFCWLVPWRYRMFQMLWLDYNHNRRVLGTRVFEGDRSNQNNPSTHHVRIRFLEEKWKYQMPVRTKYSDKVIAEVIGTFEGVEEIIAVLPTG